MTGFVRQKKFFQLLHYETLTEINPNIKTREDLKVFYNACRTKYNADLVVKEARSLYVNSIKYAISARLGDVYCSTLTLEDKLKWISDYLSASDSDKKKIDASFAEATKILQQMNELLSKIQKIVQKESLKMFNDLFAKPLYEFMKEQEWKLCDQFRRPVLEGTFPNLAAFRVWLSEYASPTVTKKQAHIYQELVKQVNDGINTHLSKTWYGLRNKIENLEKIEQFSEQRMLDA